MTKVQRKLRDAILKAAKKNKWKVTVVTVKHPNVHTRDAEKFLRKLEAAHKRASKSKLMFVGKV